VRVRDPFDDIQVGARKAVLYTVVAVMLLIAYTTLFPTQIAIIAMILSYPLMIFLHELGHFVMAKRNGMLVTEFFVGFGPRLWSVQKGETEYGLKAIPVGGYCKVVGMTNLEDIDPAIEERTYRAKSWHAKVSMAVAGPTVHFIIAFILMFTVLFFAGNYRGARPTTTLGNGAAAPFQGAAKAGLQPGDQLIAINGTMVTSWSQVHSLIDPNNTAKAGDHVHFVVRRGTQVLEKDVVLEASKGADSAGRIVAGIAPAEYVPHPGFLAAVTLAPRQVFDVSWDSLKALGSVFSPSGISNYFRVLTGDHGKNTDQSKRFISPVGFAQVANDAVRAGWVDALGLLIVINVFVGLLNLFPLLPFDGGHIAVATYEKIASLVRHRRVQVDVTKLMPITVVVMAVLGFIFVSSLYLDVTRGISNPF
jgi:membrane-associated protease RseP (regulator of RpoE activity)